jgi:hypothetical protein
LAREGELVEPKAGLRAVERVNFELCHLTFP